MYELDKYTVSLLHFDDGIKDETGKVWTANGGATVSTIQSKFGRSSLYLDGTDQYLATPSSADFNFGSGDFTVDWWEYREAGGVYPLTLSISGGKNNYGLLIGHYFKGQNNCYASSNGSTWDILNEFSLGSIDYHILNHFAIVRSGNTFYGFKNGVLTSKVTSSGNISFVNASCKIGNWDLGVNDYHYCGYIDEFRISNIARWTANFTPDQTNALLHITMNDSSEREYLLTSTEMDAFIIWFNHHTSTDTMSYAFNDIIDKSKEYLSFEKIISFKVLSVSK